jgi:hypothetical protein
MCDVYVHTEVVYYTVSFDVGSVCAAAEADVMSLSLSLSLVLRIV